MTPAKQSPEEQLGGFIDRYTPSIAAIARDSLARVRARLRGAVELVYDNYNGLVVGFGPTERSSDAIFSIVLYPRWVSLCFLRGAGLPDPEKLLRGAGSVVRHIVLRDAATLDEPGVQALVGRALERSPKSIDATAGGRIVIKSISAKQRPRRPV